MRPQSIFLFTSSAPTTTLFSDHIDANHRPAALLASALVHLLVIAIVTYGIFTAPATVHVITEHYSVRNLDFRTPEQRRAAEGKHLAAVNEIKKALPTTGGHSPAALKQAIHAAAGPQTLLQPDLTVKIANPIEIPVPRVMIWTPSKTQVKNIVAPKPAPATTSETRLSVDSPNNEIDIADFAIAESKISTPKLPVLAASTTPVVTRAAAPSEMPPATTTQLTADPTPAAVLSLSDLQMNDGPVTLPPVNETVRTNESGKLFGPEQKADEKSDSAGQGTGNGNGNGTITSASSGPSGVVNGSPAGPAQGAASGNGVGDQITATPITLPRDGRFGAVVVGQNVDDQFPEMAGVWSGRMAYTVYLHVGLARSWILQYALPRDADAAAAGNADRLDAPWPYTILRPNLTPGEVNADALMIHGFVDQSGRFENLSIVFPQACAQAPFVLKSLEQWQFRPASQNGQVAKVEVLLIIPEELQ